jgi:hypothetical protein
VIASIAEGGYTPGVVTAVLVNLPVNGLLMTRAVRKRRISGRALAAWSAGVAIATVALIPALFSVGRRLFSPFAA